VKGLSIAAPNVGFTLIDKTSKKRRKLLEVHKEENNSLNSIKNRLSRVLGQEFSENSLTLNIVGMK